MPNVQTEDRFPIAHAVSDLHFDNNKPIFRNECNWIDTQMKYLTSLFKHAENRLIIMAGDIFNRWNVSPAIINAVIDVFQTFEDTSVAVIPGQHELPWHSLNHIEMSAYHTLRQACQDQVEDVSDASDEMLYYSSKNCRWSLYGFPYGAEIQPPKAFPERQHNKEIIKICVAHQYIWIEAASYPNAPESSNARRPYLKGKLEGYDVALFGDNHIPFSTENKGLTIVNCGTFMRRHSNEFGLNPRITNIYSDGTVDFTYFDVSNDEFAEMDSGDILSNELSADAIKEFAQALDNLGETSINFKELLERYGFEKTARNIITQWLEGMVN